MYRRLYAKTPMSNMAWLAPKRLQLALSQRSTAQSLVGLVLPYHAPCVRRWARRSSTGGKGCETSLCLLNLARNVVLMVSRC